MCIRDRYQIDYIIAPPRMAKYMEYSTKIYNIYLKYVAPEDIHAYSIDCLLYTSICPRDIMTEKAFVNALTVDMALGCSTNSMLHLPAIAREAGVALNVDIANGISAKTPNLCHLAPAGEAYCL